MGALVKYFEGFDGHLEPLVFLANKFNAAVEYREVAPEGRLAPKSAVAVDVSAFPNPDCNVYSSMEIDQVRFESLPEMSPEEVHRRFPADNLRPPCMGGVCPL